MPITAIFFFVEIEVRSIFFLTTTGSRVGEPVLVTRIICQQTWAMVSGSDIVVCLLQALAVVVAASQKGCVTVGTCALDRIVFFVLVLSP